MFPGSVRHKRKKQLGESKGSTTTKPLLRPNPPSLSSSTTKTGAGSRPHVRSSLSHSVKDSSSSGIMKKKKHRGLFERAHKTSASVQSEKWKESVSDDVSGDEDGKDASSLDDRLTPVPPQDDVLLHKTGHHNVVLGSNGHEDQSLERGERDEFKIHVSDDVYDSGIASSGRGREDEREREFFRQDDDKDDNDKDDDRGEDGGVDGVGDDGDNDDGNRDDYEDDFEEYDDDFEEFDDEEEDRKDANDPKSQTDDAVRLDGDISIMTRPSKKEEAAKKSAAFSRGPKGKPRDSHVDDGLVLPVWGQPVTLMADEKQRSGHAVSRTLKKKLQKRAAKLRSLVELEEFAASIVEMPPASEYEKFFFSKDKHSISIQFPEREFMENEAQTNEVESADAVCSVPEDRSQVLPGTSLTNEWDPSRLEAFLHKISSPLLIMLEERHQTSQFERPVGENLPAWFSGFKTFPSPFLDRIGTMWSIVGVASFKSRSNFVAVAYSRSTNEGIAESGDQKTRWGFGDGLVVIWDISLEYRGKKDQKIEPVRWLICQNHPCVLSVFPSTPNLVFVGTQEGSICCWDISEVDALHIPFEGENMFQCGVPVTLRLPTYTTDGKEECLDGRPIIGLESLLVESPFEEEDAKTSVPFAAIDSAGTVNIWTVARLGLDEIDVAQSDMGVLLGGHVVFHHSARLSSFKDDSKLDAVECHGFAIDPFTGMDMFICSNHGSIFRVNREGEHHFPDEFYFRSPLESSLHFRDAPSLSQLEGLLAKGTIECSVRSEGDIVSVSCKDMTDAATVSEFLSNFSTEWNARSIGTDVFLIRRAQPPVDRRDVLCVAMSPFIRDMFVSGWDGGSIVLHYGHSPYPTFAWSIVDEPNIISVKWSHHRPSVFYGLTEDYRFFACDLYDAWMHGKVASAIRIDDISDREGRPTYMDITSSPKKDCETITIGFSTGRVVVYSLVDHMIQRKEDEENCLLKFVRCHSHI